MRRTDRLFEIIQLLRSAGKPLSAAAIASKLEVSKRTVYRDIVTLQSMRIPIEGEAGVGYIMRRGYDLPPLNFDVTEREAIFVGLSLIARTGDTNLKAAADRALSKIEGAAPAMPMLKVSNWGIENTNRIDFEFLRNAIRTHREIHIHYRSAANDTSTRTILPLSLTYYTEVAVLSGWCSLRNDFRHFRIDRISSAKLTGRVFRDAAVSLLTRMQLEDDFPANVA